MPLQATSGAASYDAFGGGVPVVPAYIEEVFGTYLYTGNDTVQTITNGIDLSTKGGAVFIKSRNLTSPTVVYDTNRGINKALCTNLTNAENVGTLGTNQDLNSFNTNGFAVNLFTNAGGGFGINNSAHNLASWTFRKQPKFFDVVTYTGNGATTRTINHSLGSVAGCIMIKATSTTGDWWVTHRNNGTDAVYGSLNLTDAMNPYGDPMTKFCTSTEFYPRLMDSSLNANGVTFVAYLFAHDAGGFGLTGTDNVISCGSYTGNGLIAGPVVTLGYEAQWVLVKRTDTTGNWQLQDNMRSLSQTSTDILFPNLSNAATTGAYPSVVPTATGFYIGDNGTGYNASGGTYIYIAIRRGPMKVPTSGTSVFNSITRTGTGTAATITGVGFAPDLVLGADRTGANTGDDCRYFWVDKLRGRSQYLNTAVTAAEAGPSSATQDVTAFGMDGISVGTTANAYFNVIADPLIHHYFKRAPSFFDEVCYTGNQIQRTITHNLSVAPELIIIKSRSASSAVMDWQCHSVFTSTTFKRNLLNTTDAATTATFPSYLYAPPTASGFEITDGAALNQSAKNYVAYLFATCAGVSKVGSYTGTATTKQIDCGFTSGARFVLIKRTDSTGNWYVWDSARGIVSGNDPYLLLNAYAPAENTSTDYVDTYSAGFEISSTAPSAINASGGTFIFLAIA